MRDSKSTDNPSPPRGTCISLLIMLILVNILIRYPTTPHLIGWDSYIIYSLAGSISEMSMATWVLHPLSYFGMYPMSYPSGIPFLISSVSQISGMNIEVVIWIYNIILGVLAAFGAFMLAGVFKNNFWFKYLVAILFSTSMGLLLVTTWSLSTRGTLVVLTPLFIWTFIRVYGLIGHKFIIPTLMILLIMATVHRMFVLVIPFIILYITTTMLIKIKLKAKSNISPSKHKRYRNLFLLIFLTGTVILFLYPLLGGFSEVYTNFLRLNNVNEILIWGTGMLARNIGPVALFSLFGMVLLTRKSGKDRHELFILGCMAIMSPLILIGKYISSFSLLFFMLLAAYGMLLFHRASVKKNKQKMFFTVTVTVLVVSFSMSGYGQLFEFNLLSEERTVDMQYLEIEGYDAAMWVKQNDVGVMIGSRLLTERMAAISNVPKLPCNDPLTLVYGYASSDDINLQSRSIFDMDFFMDSPVIDSENNAAIISWHGHTLTQITIYSSRAKSLINQYQVETLIVNNYEPSHFVLAESVMHTSYCTFQNQKVSIYVIMVP